MSELYFLDFLQKLYRFFCVAGFICSFSLTVSSIVFTIACNDREVELSKKFIMYSSVVLMISVFCLFITPSDDLIKYEIEQIKERVKK